MIFTKLRRALGIDTRQSEYTYQKDPVFGHVTSARVADKWTKTTCGYCSVGCGMLVGTKDGKAVAVRGNPDHPVNLGKLCPKGLSVTTSSTPPVAPNCLSSAKTASSSPSHGTKLSTP